MKQQTVETVLLKIGMPANVSGFHYIIDAICYIDAHQDQRIKYTEMYRAIAEKNNTTASRVERSMRHAFEIARGSHGDYEMAEHYIGFMNCSNSASLQMLYKRIMEEESTLIALNEKKAQQLAQNLDLKYAGQFPDELVKQCVRLTIQEILPFIITTGESKPYIFM